MTLSHQYKYSHIVTPDATYQADIYNDIFIFFLDQFWDQIPRTCHVFTRLFTSNTPWYFLDFASTITV